MAAKNTTPQAVLDLQKKYIDLKLENTDRFLTGTGSKARFDEAAAQKAVIEEVYKLNPLLYPSKKGNPTPDGFAQATAAYEREQPKLTFTKAENFAGAISEFDRIVQQVNTIGVDKLNKVDRATIGKMARQVRDYKSKNPTDNEEAILENINLAEDTLGKIVDQFETVRIAELRAKGRDEKGNKIRVNKQDQTNFLLNAQDTLRRYISEAANAIPSLSESLSRLDVTDVVQGIGQRDARIGDIDSGLPGLAADKLFDRSSLANRLNFQVTDDQIRADLMATRKTSAESLYKLGNEALVDLNSRLEQANAFKAGLAANDPRLKSTQDVIDSLIKDIADVTADTNQAKAIFDNPGDIGADTIASFRETLRLDEERALDEIGSIDPNYLATSRALSDQFRGMASGPLGPTQDARTEEVRGLIEDEALNQLRLGSTLDESVRREVQQATRGAQAARGNVFGVGPAVEEAMQTGLMAEQRRNQRYGAAAAFLGSGQSRGDQAARNTSLRQSLDLARLGAANDFVAAGANPYNLAAQRVSNANANAINYINAQNAASGGFANTANVVNPFMFVDPQAGFRGAQNAASIYGGLLDFTSNNYRSQSGALAQVASANSIPNYISSFSGLVPSLSF